MDIASILGTYGAQQTADIFSSRRETQETAKASAFDSRGDTVTLSQEARKLAMQMRISAQEDEEEYLEQEELEKKRSFEKELQEEITRQAQAEQDENAAAGELAAAEDSNAAGGAGGGGGGGESSSSDQIEALEKQIAEVSSQLQALASSTTENNMEEQNPKIAALQGKLSSLQQQLAELKSAQTKG